MNRAPITACIGLVLATTFAVNAAAQAKSSNQGVRRQVKSEQGSAALPEVHIVPTGMAPGLTSMEIGGDVWKARGYDLKSLIAQIFDTEAKRIDLPDSFNADTRYDVTLSLPHEVDADQMQQMLQEALEKKFAVRITPETRAMEVYVMSAPSGPGSALHPHTGADDAGQITYSGRDCPGISAHGIEVSATGLAEFGRALEADLDGVVVDETKLPGSYDFKIGNYSNPDELLKQLHDQLGLVVKPLERKVTVLKVRPQGEFASL
jgi:uncharacterized protein (TIGR03435 family)